MDLQRIIGGRNVIAAWWHDNVLIVENSRHQHHSYGGVPRVVYVRLMESLEPDLLFSLIVEHNYVRERVYLAPSQPSTIDPQTLPF